MRKILVESSSAVNSKFSKFHSLCAQAFYKIFHNPSLCISYAYASLWEFSTKPPGTWYMPKFASIHPFCRPLHACQVNTGKFIKKTVNVRESVKILAENTRKIDKRHDTEIDEKLHKWMRRMALWNFHQVEMMTHWCSSSSTLASHSLLAPPTHLQMRSYCGRIRQLVFWDLSITTVKIIIQDLNKYYL